MPARQGPITSIDDLPDPSELPDFPTEPEGSQEQQQRKPARGAVKRRHRAARSSTSSSEGSGKESKLRQIGTDLDQAFTLIGTALTPFAPLTGATLVARGPAGSDIVVNIARKDERVYRALLAVSRYAVYGELALFVGTIGIAATVDMGQQRPDSFIVRKLVGDDILVNVYGERAFSGSNGAAGTGNPAQYQQPGVPAGWPSAAPPRGPEG